MDKNRFLPRDGFRAAKAVCRPDENALSVCRKILKSSAQVAPKVSPRVGSPMACRLKPGRERPYRLMGRFSESEREIVIQRAKSVSLSVNEYMRAVALGPPYQPPLSQGVKDLLRKTYVELTRQGNNLNQIGRQMNAGMATKDEGSNLLDILARSLLSAQKAVCHVLTQGMPSP